MSKATIETKQKKKMQIKNNSLPTNVNAKCLHLMAIIIYVFYPCILGVTYHSLWSMVCSHYGPPNRLLYTFNCISNCYCFCFCTGPNLQLHSQFFARFFVIYSLWIFITCVYRWIKFLLIPPKCSFVNAWGIRFSATHIEIPLNFSKNVHLVISTLFDYSMQ